MSQHVLEAELKQKTRPADAGRRHQHGLDDRLILSELDPERVIDHLEPVDKVELITFGTVRETCPKCEHAHLKLVLRQQRVRVAHLFCSGCHSCFDAHYVNGAPALII
jgi:DNA-directed RNA polymerase subunit M/transcription elongation factor TFIIS